MYQKALARWWQQRTGFDAADLEQQFDTGVDLFAFDGSTFWHRSSDRAVDRGVARTTVSKNDKTDRDSNLFALEPLDEVLLAFDLPSVPRARESRLKHRLLTLLSEYAFRREADDLYDGHLCARLVSDRIQLWLDPALAYAMRRKLAFYEGKRVHEVRASEHKQVAPGVWIPMRVTTVTYGSKFGPPELLEVPLFQHDYAIAEFRINIPISDAMFRIDPDPGEWVIDHTREPRVSYIQPADKTRVDDVIARALRQSQRAASSQRTSFAQYLLVFNVIVVFCLGLLLVSRWWLRRREWYS
jgi:hypothetical protein